MGFGVETPQALKGSVPCHPTAEGSDDAGSVASLFKKDAEGKIVRDGTGHALAKAARRVCCNPKALRQRMKVLEDMGCVAIRPPLLDYY